MGSQTVEVCGATVSDPVLMFHNILGRVFNEILDSRCAWCDMTNRAL